MLETARFDGKRRVRGTAILAVGLSLYSAFIIWYFDVADAEAYEAVVESVPPELVEAFGVAALGSIEGWLGAQIYTFVWMLGLGIYFAYLGAGLVAKDIERQRMDMIAVFPVSRARLLGEKFASLLVPIIGLNIAICVVNYALVIAVGESTEFGRVVLVHTLSIPYFLVCAALGVLLSVMVHRAAVAERLAIGFMFFFWMFESVVGTVDTFSWLRYASPTYYYRTTEILIDGTYEVLHPLILLIAFIGIFGSALLLFKRRDL